MTNIKPITKYPCPVSGKLFDSLREAQNSATKESAKRERDKLKAAREKASAQKREKLRNSIRLEAESIKDIEEMLNSRAKLLFPNERIPKVTIAGVRVSPFEIKEPVAFRSCAQISFELNFASEDGYYSKVCKLVESGWSDQKGFRGFSSGGGGTGRHYVSISLKDWPKIWAKYRATLKLEKYSRQNKTKENEAEAKTWRKVIENSEYKSLEAKIQDLQGELRELGVALKKKYYKAPKLKDVARLEELRAAFRI
jgi:hypothetical protein